LRGLLGALWDYEKPVFGGNGWKLKGMRWATDERFEGRHDELVQVSLQGIAVKLGFLQKVLSS
jgi:hypothetical protein